MRLSDQRAEQEKTHRNRARQSDHLAEPLFTELPMTSEPLIKNMCILWLVKDFLKIEHHLTDVVFTQAIGICIL